MTIMNEIKTEFHETEFRLTCEMTEQARAFQKGYKAGILKATKFFNEELWLQLMSRPQSP